MSAYGVKDDMRHVLNAALPLHGGAVGDICCCEGGLALRLLLHLHSIR